jgi:serine/threonine-protein kinase RsbW
MNESEERLELDSRLAELGRVGPWAETLADKHHLGREILYAVQLCMEEALANVIMHGYRNEPGHPILIRSSIADGWLYFAIQDEAPPFAPDALEAATNGRKPANLESIQPGGNGIRLMRRFAGSMEYEVLPIGNRLTLGFPLSQGAGMISARPE